MREGKFGRTIHEHSLMSMVARFIWYDAFDSAAKIKMKLVTFGILGTDMPLLLRLSSNRRLCSVLAEQSTCAINCSDLARFLSQMCSWFIGSLFFLV